MSQPVVQLDDFGLTDLRVHWEADADEGQQAISNLTVAYTVRTLSADPTKYRLTMTVKEQRRIKQGDLLSSVEATILGFFSFPDGTTTDEREKRIRLNGLTMLYGALRGALATVRGIFPPNFRYVLPSVNMLEVIKNVEEKRARKTSTKRLGQKTQAATGAHHKPRVPRAAN